jgi:hypothetical protein
MRPTAGTSTPTSRMVEPISACFPATQRVERRLALVLVVLAVDEVRAHARLREHVRQLLAVLLAAHPDHGRQPVRHRALHLVDDRAVAFLVVHDADLVALGPRGRAVEAVRVGLALELGLCIRACGSGAG